MAEAYAALVSIMQILDQLKNHSRPPISLHKNQVQSLSQIVTFLQDFLQDYNNHDGYSKEVDAIAEAAHAVEDVIESHIVDRILADGEELSSVDFYEALQKVIDDLELVKREIMGMREKMGVDSSTSVASPTSASVGQNQTMVGFDDILLEILDKLTNQKSSREIFSIAGMGGIGKTTLARNVYEHDLVVQHFDFLAWLTISQQYNFGKILRKVLKKNGENLSLVDENDLGYKLHQMLSGRRYLIIIDDIWNMEVWDQLNLFLPDNNNGSRIMITTRLSNLARQIDESHNIVMDFMDEDNSWKLFCKHVFGKEDCPLELKEIGRTIVRGCKGLPLSISVVGGLLAKSNRTQQQWEHIAENVNSIVNLEDNEHCLQILYMSYYSLPVHLKPCFLYMGCFDEDEEIIIVLAIAMWIGEGFVRPVYGKSLEEAAKEYVTELIDRNLLLISKEDKSLPDVMDKSCKIHDLLRDLCLRESVKQKFLNVVGDQSLISHNIRRLYITDKTPENEILPILESSSLVRSLWWEPVEETSLSSISFRLLRVAIVKRINYVEDIVWQVNMRVIIVIEVTNQCRIPSSISGFWNLQTLVIGNESLDLVIGPFQIWNLPQLRIVLVDRLCLLDPPSGDTEMADCSVVLENLHQLASLHNFKCSEEVVKRIPHIKYLRIGYVEAEGSSLADYYLKNIRHLQELERLEIVVQMQSQMVQNLGITFPHSLKYLVLLGTALHWDDLTTKIGSLPLLQYLELDQYSCVGAKWETVEGQFCKLEYLKVSDCGDLEYWMTENSHFPCLKFLILEGLHKLFEIPSSIGDIPTLQSIEVEDCCDSVCDSAERIKCEQEELGNEDLQVQVCRMQQGEEDTSEDEVEEEDSLKDGTEEEYNVEDEETDTSEDDIGNED